MPRRVGGTAPRPGGVGKVSGSEQSWGAGPQPGCPPSSSEGRSSSRSADHQRDQASVLASEMGFMWLGYGQDREILIV